MEQVLSNDSHFQFRRDVLKRFVIGCIALLGGDVCTQTSAEERANSLRVVAYNVYNANGWPKERAQAAAGQMPDRLAMELSLYSPDIINFSESPQESVVRQIAKRLRMNYVFFPSAGNWPGALLSRHEIVNSQNVPLREGNRPEDLFTRHWGKATVQLPSGESLVVHSVHLHPPPSAEDIRGSTDIRVREIGEMLKSMRNDFEAGRSMLLIGDFNHDPVPPEYPMWINAGWVDTFSKVGKGNGLTIKSDQPKWRFDYVMVAGPLKERVIESRPLFEGAFRTNTADPNSFALSDHLPQFAVFEIGE